MIDEYKKRLKEITDKVSNSQPAQGITTTQTPKISTSTNTTTTTTNKSGTAKSTATITKEPKRQPFSRVHHNPLSEDDDRMFLEGFYEVDYASSDHERKKRMTQVEESLQRIRNSRAGNMIRKTNDAVQPAKYSSQNATTPRAELHAAPSWFSPLEKSNDNVVNAGREYAANLVDDKFNQGWLYALGKENIYDYSSPVYNSRYKNVLIDSVIDNAKADFVAGLAQGLSFFMM